MWNPKDKLLDAQRRNKNLEEQIKDLESQINQLKEEKAVESTPKKCHEKKKKKTRNCSRLKKPKKRDN